MSAVPLIKSSNSLNHYISLLSLSYHQAVERLLLKHGSATTDYFKEQSYIRFLNGEIANITKSNYSRTSDGLYCHHIDEYEFENLANKAFIQFYQYSFKYQRKERLVYCDLIEHLILHALITKETNGEKGYSGLVLFLIPQAKEWYIDKKEPKPQWMKICKERAHLSSEQIYSLLTYVDPIVKSASERLYMKKSGRRELHRRLNLNLTIKQYEDYKNLKERKQLMKKELQYNIYELLDRQRKIKEKEKIEKRIRDFNSQFSALRDLKITPYTSRKKILDYLFDYHYKDTFPKKKEFYSYKMSILKEDLISEFNNIVKSR
ncbi:hypothetical protein [Macrococcus carouselicus]|uniref:Uncharacterized protein n=1 Tax=Macrococcus carouselicus TaxID=69969 RepID=A0A9Q8CJ46_9STAP|nr:hypothetical protein [Macrococcus carouselicus]TDL95539.1 hypothetical protein ERX40_10170 [Macrococcus carouselicus]